MVNSVRLSHLFHYVPFIVSSGKVITYDQGEVHAKGRDQMSKVKVTEVKTQPNRFRTVTPIWIHIWWWMMHKAWCCLGEVSYCFSMLPVKFQGHSGGNKTADFNPNWVFRDSTSNLNSSMSTKWCKKAWSSIEEVLYAISMSCVKFQGHTAKKASMLAQIGRFRTLTPVWNHQWLRIDA